ncbi:MAG: hypothetical protein AABW67_04135 [Nanoarchaeota archaeon]
MVIKKDPSHAKRGRRNKNLLLAQKYIEPTLPNVKYNYSKNNSYHELDVEEYINELNKDIKLYEGLKKKRTFIPNILTQIERQVNKLAEFSCSFNLEGKGEYLQSYYDMKEHLDEIGFWDDFEKYDKRCKTKGLEKDDITNHYSLVHNPHYRQVPWFEKL